jgi:hypothetical protein
VRRHVGRQGAETGDEIEVGPVRADQAEGVPTHPNDEIGLIGTFLAEAVQTRGAGKVAVADADLARDGCATLDRLGTVLVGQLQVREAAAAEIVGRMEPPTGRLAATLAEATAVGIAQDAPSPAQRGTGSLELDFHCRSRRATTLPIGCRIS